MPAPAKTPDFDSPKFPHGQMNGYRLGCRTAEDCPASPPCINVARRERKLNAWRRAGLVPLGDQNMIPVGRLSGHITMLLSEVPGSSYGHIGKAAGLTRNAIWEAHLKLHDRARVATFRKVMTVTPDMVRDHVPQPCKRYTQLVRSLQAQAWPLQWQAEQYERPLSSIKRIARGEVKTVEPETARRIEALARAKVMEIGPSRASAAKARRLGWHSLLAYDDEGDLVPGAVRNEGLERRREERDHMARNRLEVLRMSLEYSLTATAIGERVGLDRTVVQKFRTQVGLRFETQRTIAGIEGKTVLLPECKDRAAEIRVVLDRYYNDPVADPFKAVRELGLMMAARYDFDQPLPLPASSPEPVSEEEAA